MRQGCFNSYVLTVTGLRGTKTKNVSTIGSVKPLSPSGGEIIRVKKNVWKNNIAITETLATTVSVFVIAVSALGKWRSGSLPEVPAVQGREKGAFKPLPPKRDKGLGRGLLAANKKRR